MQKKSISGIWRRRALPVAALMLSAFLVGCAGSGQPAGAGSGTAKSDEAPARPPGGMSGGY
jgi:hypothetical protein